VNTAFEVAAEDGYRPSRGASEIHQIADAIGQAGEGRG
jgi:hypothetical protein